MFLVPVAMFIAPKEIASGNAISFMTNFAFYAIFSAITSTALNKIMYTMAYSMEAESAINRIEQVMDAPQIVETKNPKMPKDSSIEFRNVSFRYSEDENYAIKSLTKEKTVVMIAHRLSTVVVNLIVMSGIAVLYYVMDGYMKNIENGAPLQKALPIILSILLFAVCSFITHLQQYIATYGLVYGDVKDIRIGLAESLRKLPLAFFGKKDLSDLTETVMSDVNRMEHVWSHVLPYLYGAYISTFIIGIGMMICDWRMAIACLWGVPVAFGMIFLTKKFTKATVAKTKKVEIKVSDGMQEIIENVREIHSINGKEKFYNKICADIDDYEKKLRAGEFSIGIFVNIASVVMRLGVATTILLGANLIVKGQIDFMIFFGFILAITRIYTPFDQCLALLSELFLSEVSAERLRNIYDEVQASGENKFEPQGHDIKFENVSFSYDDDVVLDHISFTAKEGEVTALVGPSGSGKSTCARLAARLWDVSGGIIEVGGVDILKVEPETLHRDYSMVFQNVLLFDDTIMENIRIGKHGASDEEVMQAARLANCDEFVKNMKDGYNTIIGENGEKLSGGERQRISIARAILKDAPIVFLDEATASLDVENESKVQEALSRLLKGKTVLVIAHRMRTVEAADKIIVLKNGKIVEEGKPSELMKDEHGEFNKMLNLQRNQAQWSV